MLFRATVLLLALVAYGEVQAQTTFSMPEMDKPFEKGFPAAQFTSVNQIVLDQNAPLSEFYVGDISELKFKDDDELMAWLNKLTADNYCQYMISLTERKVLLYFDLQKGAPGWGVTGWNEYLNSRLSK